MLWHTYDMLKSFWWHESAGFNPTSSPDRISGVYNLTKIMVPSWERNGQWKLIYCVEKDVYFLVISTQNRLEIYSVDKLSRNVQKVYSQTDIQFKQIRRSYTKDGWLVILRDNKIIRINLYELDSMNDEDDHKVLLTLPSENEFNNFVIMDKSKILLTSPRSILLYDIVEEHMINKIDIDLSQVRDPFNCVKFTYH